METIISPEEKVLAETYVMPSVKLGSPVFFYDRHDLANPILGFVARHSRTGKNLVIRTTDGHVYDGVRHVTDPKLTWNHDHRESGSWDYTDEWKRVEEEREEMKARIAALEHSATKTATRRKKATS